MWVGRVFPGDEHERVMYAQHGVYGDVVVELVRRGLEHYAKAVDMTGTGVAPAPTIRAIESFDHRVVQEAHDLIAAWYRFSAFGREPVLPELLDEARERERWRTFAGEEIGRLLEQPPFVRALVTAVVFQNQKEGRAAERDMEEFLRERYAPMFTSGPFPRGGE